MCFVAAPGGGPALAPRSDIAVCGVGILELVVAPVVVRLDRRRMKRISLFI